MLKTENKENFSQNNKESNESDLITQRKKEISEVQQSIELLKLKIKQAKKENAQKTQCYEKVQKDKDEMKRTIKNVVQQEQQIFNNTITLEGSHLAYIKQLVEYQKFKTISNDIENKVQSIPHLIKQHQVNQEKICKKIDETLNSCCQINHTVEDLIKQKEAAISVDPEMAQDKREIAKLEAAIKRIELKSAFTKKSLERKEDEYKALSELHMELQSAGN